MATLVAVPPSSPMGLSPFSDSRGSISLARPTGSTKKKDESLPYNAMQTDKLKDTVKSNVTAIVQEKTKQTSDFWQSSYAKKAINKTVQAVKNADAITKVKNTLDPTNIKAAAAKTYEDMVKAPIAKTQAALKEKKEQLLDRPLPNFGLAPEALGPATNMTVREEIESAKNTVMQIVGGKDGGGERNNDRENTKFSYKNNPMDNPKVAKEVEENPEAVYGYSPKPESNLNNLKVDWTDPEEVANAQSERIKYHEKLERQRENLRNEIEELSNKGYSVEEIARIKVLQRNEGRINSYLKSMVHGRKLYMRVREVIQGWMFLQGYMIYMGVSNYASGKKK